MLVLSLIALASVFGTVIKQGASPEEYLAVYSERTYRIISLLGLDDAYRAPWFIALVLLFAMSLVFCTLRRLALFVKEKRGIRLPGEDRLSKMELHAYVRGKGLEETIGILTRDYRIAVRQGQGAVLERGRLSRYGVFIIHTSILVILAGGFAGLLFGYRGFVTLGIGETKDRLTLSGKESAERPLGFALRCKDFRVNHYPTGEPKDYVSTVEIIEKEKVVLEKEIRVNDPLSYKGTRIYQSTYGSAPVFLFNIGGEEVALTEREIFRKKDLLLMPARFENRIHDFGPGVLVAYLDNGEPKAVWFLKGVDRLREQTLQGVKVSLNDIREQPYTGLEVSEDPGVPMVWTGFALILLGLYVNFFLHYRRIYLLTVPEGLLVAGMALKNREDFKREFEKMVEEIHGHTS
ncbi:MAG: Cytochrome c biogenesis protein CcsB [Syntrophorhabdus sp. PtaU1.Bin058]|nr:MAG: Cytochrome c biogenesis protein CcsB [Syntrophorhabdus sp. PtaU1.Bin058]